MIIIILCYYVFMLPFFIYLIVYVVKESVDVTLRTWLLVILLLLTGSRLKLTPVVCCLISDEVG